MANPTLIKVATSKLQPGMLIHSIVEQRGKLSVKSKGRISHKAVIKQLAACGVESVMVQLDQAKPASKQKPKTVSPKAPAEEKIARRRKALAIPKTESEKLEFAEQLVGDLKKTYDSIRVLAEKGTSVSMDAVEYIVDEMMHMLRHNTDALLLISMLRNSGEYLNNHSVHCAILLCHFAQQMGMSETDCKRLAIVGFLFDVGMAKIPKEITHKAERPSVEEQKIIESHVHHSLELVANMNLDQEQLLAIEQHHERLDGSGYQKGLEGENIHLFARMLAIVDTFDAMTTKRPFSKQKTPAAALKIICNPQYGYDQKLAVKFLRSVGVYPAGCVVALSNKKLAMVVKNNDDPIKPIVKSFFSLQSMQHCDCETIDLSEKNNRISILKPVIPEHYGIKMEEELPGQDV